MNSTNKLHRKYYGFTIVELLVVIVVIAILAAITIVSYSGITSRATATALQSDLANASRVLKLYYAEYGTYPATDNVDETSPGSKIYCTDDTDYCYKSSNSNYTLTYMYAPNNFVVTSTNTTTSYYITANSSPNTGGNNLLYTLTGDSASFEDGETKNWIAGTGITIASTTEEHYHGSRSMKVTRGAIDSYALINVLDLTSQDDYVYQFRIKGTSGKQIDWGVWTSGIWSFTTYTLNGNWEYLSNTFTRSTQSFIRIRVTFKNGSSGDVFYLDAVQLERGSTPSQFY